jgi:hypothetical protein
MGTEVNWRTRDKEGRKVDFATLIDCELHEFSEVKSSDDATFPAPPTTKAVST